MLVRRQRVLRLVSTLSALPTCIADGDNKAVDSGDDFSEILLLHFSFL